MSIAPVVNDDNVSPFILATTYVRAVLSTLFCIAFTLFMSIFVITAGQVGCARLATKFMRFWSQMVLWVFNVRVNATGLGNLPASGGAIMVFNHQSHFDIPVLMLSTKQSIRFGAKIELFKIPMFGLAMRAVGTLPIARDNRNEVLRIYKMAATRFKENTIFVLAPEGTRQSEPKLGKFKKGPVFFALGAQVPIIPAVIKGAGSVLPKGGIAVNVGKWSRTVSVEYLPPIQTLGLGPENADRLTQEARESMNAVFEGRSTVTSTRVLS